MADNVVKIDSRQCIILRDFGEKIVWLLEHHSITLDRLYKLPISKILDHLRYLYPQSFFPRTFVVKCYRQLDGRSPEYQLQAEMKAYRKLKSVQGTSVPRFYCCTRYLDHPAIVIQYVEGDTFSDKTSDYRKNIQLATSEILDKAEEQARQLRLADQYAANAKDAKVIIENLKHAITCCTKRNIKLDLNGENVIVKKNHSVFIIDFAQQQDTGHSDDDKPGPYNKRELDRLLRDNGLKFRQPSAQPLSSSLFTPSDTAYRLDTSRTF